MRLLRDLLAPSREFASRRSERRLGPQQVHPVRQIPPAVLESPLPGRPELLHVCLIYSGIGESS
jgi:hypothetical protein